MKIKAYHPGLNSKLFLGLWFVLFTVLLVMANWFFTRQLYEINALSGRLTATEKQITHLQAVYAEFLISQDKGDNLFIVTENSAEKDAKSCINSIKLDLDYYRELGYLSRNSKISASLDELSVILADAGNNLNDFFLSSREKGNYSNGLVSRWMGLSSKMLTASNPPGADVVHNLNLIKQSEFAYLQQEDPRILERIALLCEETRNQIIPEEGGIDLADLDNYVSLTGNLIALDKRMGKADGLGIAADLSRALEKLQLQFDTARLMIDEACSKQKNLWSVVHFSMILMILAAFILWSIRITNQAVFSPLRKLAGFANDLAEGGLPEETLNPGNLPDMKSIRDSLAKVVLLIREKIAITRALNERRLYTDQALAGERDILGTELMALQQKIVAAAEQQLKNEEENLKRRYINEGLAKFGEILRSMSNDINDLGDAFIREMVKYLNAIQGGFFIYDDAEKSAPVLRMVSAFAYNRKKYLQKSIAFGEGLVGTCAREKQSINLTEIPAGYISITSGLGETLPDNLLLVPVLHENILIGVLEIASLNQFKDHEIAFAEEVARSLGSTIIYTRNNQRTAELLATSQQQALEMAEQEEEMRQNMEELKATQEESGRREEEYRGIAEAIDQALFIIEYDLDGIIRAVNEKFCIFMGRSREEIIGNGHREVLHSTLKPDAHFWDELQKNHHMTVMEVVKIGQKSYRLQEHFTTVHNRDGLLIKFINFATDDRAGNS